MSSARDYKNTDDFKERSGYEIDGIWYPRVTKITNMKVKPALYHFYGQFGYYRAKEISKKSAEEGTAVHEAIEKLLTKQKVGEVPVSISPSIYAFIEFFKENDIEVDPSHVEKRIIHLDHRYAGTIDSLARIGDKFGVLDIKTSEAIYRDYDIQTAAYFSALKKEFPELNTRWILRIDQNAICKECKATKRTKGGREKIKKNGSSISHQHDWNEVKGVVELKEITSDWQEDFDAFLGAKKLWEWEHKDLLKKIGY